MVACQYCGTTTKIARSDGTGAPQNVSKGIRTKHRWADRTAAELALPRLARELENLKERRTAALQLEQEHRKRSVVRKLQLVGATFVLMLIALPFVFTETLSLTGREYIADIAKWLWLGVTLFVTFSVYKRVHIEPNQSKEIDKSFDNQIDVIQSQIKANQSIVDSPLESNNCEFK